MTSEWRVTSNVINGETMYAVYRLIDVRAVDHSGNRELATGYLSDKTEAENIAIKLNKAC